MSLPATISIPRGYRLLDDATLTRTGDLGLGIDYPSSKPTTGHIGEWEALDPVDIGWRADTMDGPVIRPTKTTLKRARRATKRRTS